MRLEKGMDILQSFIATSGGYLGLPADVVAAWSTALSAPSTAPDLPAIWHDLADRRGGICAAVPDLVDGGKDDPASHGSPGLFAPD